MATAMLSCTSASLRALWIGDVQIAFCDYCKSLYGLKQAPRIWYLLLCETILSLRFIQCTSDPSIYFHLEYKVLAVYIDDILILGSSGDICHPLYSEFSHHFPLDYIVPIYPF